ncbi:galactose oxidase [Dothidotthia symphoricarpi CBS 119687]|uniref:Galactose oxidase n=1 Tax=Dothidotthia symphoricarpi CBS 119687 TaxID=1392245 RepID=A0A6A6AQE6_9PLEO|nr:galactose oxidase [Dothidotthia symphoricarpi CBS 119687]KAF2133235.1 galactose oxidase [Dothidotthia symphoricarpi CBS 119687]
MEPASTGVAYAGQLAAALFKGIKHPTLPLKANLTRISSVPLARSHHTICTVKGRAYIFGGEDEPGRLASNDMHIVILPSSGVLEADYTTIPARALNGLDDVPGSRKGHTAVVIGDSMYMFGGEGEGVENEKGRVWVYDTISNAWSILDPASSSLFPSQRTEHASASSNLPEPKTKTFRERAPQAPVDPAQNVPEPAEDSTWGTIFVIGGRDTSTNQLSNDALAFDVKTRTWSNIPSPAGQPRDGASLALVGDHLYRFGGKGVETFASGGMESLDVSPVWKHAEGGTTPLTGGWAWEEVSHKDSKDSSAPQARSKAGLVGLTTGQGRHYLIAIGGEGEATSSSFLDDIWAFQLASERKSAAAAKDDFRAKIKKDTHESKWAEVHYKYVDTKGEEEREIPGEPKSGLGARGHFGLAKGTEVDGATCVVWGGVDAQGQVLEDGWMITVDR